MSTLLHHNFHAMKFSLYNGKQQQEHINETLEHMMAKAGWQQSFKSEFFRLGLGYAAVAVALYVYYLEKNVPFRDSRFFIGFLCLIYFACTWFAWLWERTYERNAFYIGTKDGVTAWIASKYPKNSSVLEISATKSVGGNVESQKLTFEFASVVDRYSVVHQEELAPVVTYLELSAEKKNL